MEMVPIQKQTI